MWLLFNLCKTQSYQQVIIANQRYGLRDGAVLTRALKLINEIESKKKKMNTRKPEKSRQGSLLGNKGVRKTTCMHNYAARMYCPSVCPVWF